VFAHAIDIASRFTFPFVTLRRDTAGRISTSVAAFIVVNDAGWVLTSGHVVDQILSDGVESPEPSGDGEPDGSSRIVERSEIWALPGFSATPARMVEARVNRLADLGLCRLEPFDSGAIGAFPVFRDPASPIAQGMSVCRLGFPFYDVEAVFDEKTQGFMLSSDAFPIPRFALDGIVARFNRRAAEDGSVSALFIETSTPGLRGQSGGPLVDVDGRVCGIQSYTSHLDLGFDAHYQIDSELVIERQFLNVGAATHVAEVHALLGEAGVAYSRG